MNGSAFIPTCLMMTTGRTRGHFMRRIRGDAGRHTGFMGMKKFTYYDLMEMKVSGRYGIL